MLYEFVYDLQRVLAFVRTLLPGLHQADNMVAMGLERDGRMVAGVLYEGINAHNCWMHIAVEPGANWAGGREFMRAVFAYPFRTCGVRRVSAYVNERNERSVRLCRRLGFREEAILRGAATDGGSVIVMVLWRDECHFLKG